MKITDLTAGMRVENRSGEQGLVIDNGGGTLYLSFENACARPINIRNYYKHDLTIFDRTSGHHNDIMKVWGAYSVAYNCDLSKKVVGPPYWERVQTVKITMELALETLKRAHDGREVEIINEGDELSYRQEIIDETPTDDWHEYDEPGIDKERYEQHGAEVGDFVLLKGHANGNGLKIVYHATQLMFCGEGVLYPEETGEIGCYKITHFKVLPRK